jgi:hypothetical protein
MVPRAPNSGENSQITNGATCKVKRGGRRRKKEKEKTRKKGRHPILRISHGTLFGVTESSDRTVRLLHESCPLLWCGWVDVAQPSPAWRTIASCALA